MLKLVICDDEKVYRQDLKNIIETELDLSGISYQTTEFDCGEDLLKSPLLADFQIVFLDIEMKRLNGIETAKGLRAQNSAAVIIFVTSYADFVFEGYEVRALNYLLKPYDKEKIVQVLRLALSQLQLPSDRYYVVETRGKSTRLPLDRIKYFFSDKRSVTAVTTESSYTFYGKLNEVEDELPDFFIRIHNRYLINLKYLKTIESSSVLVDDEMLPVSRTFKQELSISFAKYMLQ